MYMCMTNRNIFEFTNSLYYYNYIYINNEYVKINYSYDILTTMIYSFISLIIIILITIVFDILNYQSITADTLLDHILVIPFFIYIMYRDISILVFKTKFDKYIELSEKNNINL